ncbi:MAG: ABC transporter permease [Chitinophagales bacterium]|nr:ABC transporter permease [Chitinophagales bacterium]
MASAKSTSYFYAIVGISLVLFVLGIAAAFVYKAKKTTTEFKENLTIEVVLKDEVDTAETASLQATIKGKKYVKNIRFVSKEEAAKILRKDLGENFLDILGYNPLYHSFLVNVYEEYTAKTGLEVVQKELMALPEVKQVNFQKNALESFDKTAGRASFIILVVAGLLLAFAVSLIFNTIRLAMFSNRFTIKTMQLFGATRWFIIKPFLGKSLLNGFISGLIACLLLTAVIAYFDYVLPELGLRSDLITFALLFGALILFGIFISFFSTLTAVLRYLRVKVDDLY